MKTVDDDAETGTSPAGGHLAHPHGPPASTMVKVEPAARGHRRERPLPKFPAVMNVLP